MNTFSVIKRDGSHADFEIQRIINAIKKAASAVNISDEFYCHQIGQEVTKARSTSIKSKKSWKINLWQVAIPKWLVPILNIVMIVI